MSWPFQQPVDGSGNPNEPTLLVAKYQKWIIFSILISLALIGYYLLTLSEAVTMPPVVKTVLDNGISLLSQPLALFMGIAVFLLARQFYSERKSLVLALLMCVPLLGLIILLSVNHSATQYLRRCGLEVGLFGAKL